jgi:hypothetical protein
MRLMRNLAGVFFVFGVKLLAGCAGSTPGSQDGFAGVANVAGNPPGGGSGSGSSGAAGTGSSGTGNAMAGGDGSSGAGTGPAAACAAYATARCARYRACLPMRFAILYSSFADCEQATRVTCLGELSAPGTSRTPLAVSACALDSAAQSCADWLGALPASCAEPGSLAVDAGCEYNSQCASRYCQRAQGSWCGVCRARDIAGAPCDPQQGSCISSLRCAYGCPGPDSCAAADMVYRCAQEKALGSACDNVTECRPGLVCVSGACTTPKGLGEVCDSKESLSCDVAADLSCVDGVCIENSYAAAGAVCNTPSASYCSGLGACDGSDGHAVSTGPGTCSPPGAEGEACSSDSLCHQPALCLGGSCTSPVNAETCF